MHDTQAVNMVKTFRYEVMWEAHENWGDTLRDSWMGAGQAVRMEELRVKLRSVATDLGRWNKNTFGSVRKEIKTLKTELERLRGDLARTDHGMLSSKLMKGSSSFTTEKS